MKIKRLVAYLIDILIVGFISSSLSSLNIINPYYDKYLDVYDDYQEVLESDINDLDEIFNSDFKGMYHDLVKYSSISNVISLSCYLLYFVGFQKWNKDQTVGKKLMRIKVVGRDKSVSILSYFLRSVVVYNLLFPSINIISSFILNDNLFFTSSIILSIIGSVVTYACLLMIIIRKDNLGLHDIISKTKVVEE